MRKKYIYLVYDYYNNGNYEIYAFKNRDKAEKFKDNLMKNVGVSKISPDIHKIEIVDHLVKLGFFHWLKCV